MKIPFDIKHREKIESGEYQLMSGDKKARIICWDARGYEVTHIVALVGNYGEPENILRFYKNGELISDSARRRTKDLYILTSPNEDNFTDFETRLYAICKASSFITFNHDTIKKWSAELLKLAKREPDRRYHEGLPMWEYYTTRPSCGWNNSMYYTNNDGYLYACGKRIKLSEIESLPMKDE